MDYRSSRNVREMPERIKIGIVKMGCIGTLPLLEFLLDERAEREDLEVRVVGSGAKMSPEETAEVSEKLLEFKPHIAIAISPNATLPGPTKARELLLKANIPTIVISDPPAKKIVEQLKVQGYGYIIVEADSMIGARREFLDPTEMALFNSDIIKVLSVTGVYRIIYAELENLIKAVKKDETLTLPHIVITKEIAVDAAGFQNPYAKAKAMAAYEISRKVADLTVEGCFVLKERERYIPTVAAAHEMMRVAAKLADEARELEKSGDTVLRTPHDKDGAVLKKRKLIEKPESPA